MKDEREVKLGPRGTDIALAGMNRNPDNAVRKEAVKEGNLHLDGDAEMGSIEEKFNHLPPDLKDEVIDFIEFLLQKRAGQQRHKLKQGWAGALKDYRDRYTSLELQEKSLQWRGD